MMKSPVARIGFCVLTFLLAFPLVFALASTVLVGSSAFAADPEVVAKPEAPHAGSGAIKAAHVDFIQPKDGQTISQKYMAKFSVEGMKIAPAGKIEIGTGHFHLLIDTPPVKEGVVIPADATHVHFGKGQAEYEMNLTPGTHTLVLQFADGAHRAYNDMMTKTITVTVK